MGWTSRKMKRYQEEVRNRFHTPVGKASPPFTHQQKKKRGEKNKKRVTFTPALTVKPHKARRTELELLEEQTYRFNTWKRH